LRKYKRICFCFDYLYFDYFRYGSLNNARGWIMQDVGQKLAYLICFVVISIAVTGYFVGLQSPMNPLQRAADTEFPAFAQSTHLHSGVVPATQYSEMGSATRERFRSVAQTSLRDLKSNFDLLAEIKITPEEKAFALAIRKQNRAFNGAPPTIPHAVDQLSAEACAACHTDGTKTETLRIPKMSHQFLANCTQCHVEHKPQHMPAVIFRENTFVGLAAPDGGPRAYAGAPPQIPHSTWMRVDCASCHGFAGPQGIRTTHPWRQNCQQCHAPSATLDQVQLDSQPAFLPPLAVEEAPSAVSE
jgi:cytochrome c-type protein NapB